MWLQMVIVFCEFSSDCTSVKRGEACNMTCCLWSSQKWAIRNGSTKGSFFWDSNHFMDMAYFVWCKIKGWIFIIFCSGEGITSQSKSSIGLFYPPSNLENNILPLTKPICCFASIREVFYLYFRRNTEYNGSCTSQYQEPTLLEVWGSYPINHFCYSWKMFA